MPTNSDIWRERNGTAQRIAQGVASGYTPSDVQPDDRFYVLPPGERPVGPGAYGPLLENLQFFADYENWSAGQPLPNRWDVNSQITSLSDNNTVQEDTITPLVGSKSGLYDAASTEYHSTPVLSYSQSEAIVWSAWVRPDDLTSGRRIWSKWGSKNDFIIRITDNGRLELLINQSDGFPIVKTSNTIASGTRVFVNAFYDPQVGEIGVAYNDGAFSTATVSEGPTNGSDPLRLSDSNQTFDGAIDNAAIEVGSLEWKRNRTWLYNDGAGRSWNEIKNYTP